MKFYDLDFEEQSAELENMIDEINIILSEIENDNPFKDELVDLMNRIWNEKNKTDRNIPKDNTNEYLTAEYWKNQL